MFNIFAIFSFLKKNFSKKDILIGFLILILFFLTRLIYLDKNPIFSDEGIYIRWAKVAWHDPTWRFISLTDGKQPLQTWVTIPFLKIFPDNALLAGRLFAVFSGLFSLLGIFALSFYLFGKRVAYISSLLYITTPFFLFFDRIALVDSFVAASYIWMFFLSLILANFLRLDIALIFGFLTGIFLLAKSSVSLFVLNSFFGFINIFKEKKDVFKKIINYLILFLISTTIAYLIYNVQRLSPFLHYVAEKNKTFVLTWDEFLKNPFQVFWHNFRYIPYYIAHSLGYASFIFGLFGFYLIGKKNFWLALYFLLWIILPYGPMSFFMRLLSIRYTIFLAPLFIVGTAYFINYLFLNKKNFIKKSILILIAYLFTLYFSYTVIFAYDTIPFPPLPSPSVDRGQYIEGWPAGWGIKEFMDFAREKSKEKPVIILAEGNFGMSADVLDVFLKRDDKITIKGYWPFDEKPLFEHQSLLDKNYVFVFYSHRNQFPSSWPLKLIKKIKKPGNQSQFYIFQLVK
ncbi:MAG: ArnT family glycosyltransferase [Microgenomates group bacterium]